MLIRSITQNAMDKKFSIRKFPSPEHRYIAFPQKNLAVLDISRFTFCKIDYLQRAPYNCGARASRPHDPPLSKGRGCCMYVNPPSFVQRLRHFGDLKSLVTSRKKWSIFFGNQVLTTVFRVQFDNLFLRWPWCTAM